MIPFAASNVDYCSKTDAAALAAAASTEDLLTRNTEEEIAADRFQLTHRYFVGKSH